jgi:hypothetical protein
VFKQDFKKVWIFKAEGSVDRCHSLPALPVAAEVYTS